MNLFKLSTKSLFNRKFSTLLTLLSIALSTSLLIGIQRVTSSTKSSFESTVSGVDLIVGARSGSINLLLYSVFRIGNATNNIPHKTFSEISSNEEVAWTIPISLGDSHRGYKVIGTNENYFKHYMYGGDRNLKFQKGDKFAKIDEVVIGSKVAEQLGYDLGKQIILSHGTSEITFQDHDQIKFKVVGILKPTGTPVDQSLHVSLKAIEALHIEDYDGSENVRESDVTAFFLKLKSKMSLFDIQRSINDNESYPLMAIIPSLTLRDLWGTIGVAERILFVVSLMVLLVSLLGMVIALISSLNERRREMAILRSMGAHPFEISFLLVFESVILAVSGIILGIFIVYGALIASYPVLEEKMGLSLGLFTFTNTEFVYILIIALSAIVAGLFPALLAYRTSLSDGLKVSN